MKRNILITGVSGLLGNNVACFFRDNHRVVGIYNNHPVVIQGVETLGLNLLDYSETRSLITTLAPDIVIHCASRTDVDVIETKKEEGWQANVLASRVVLDALRDQKSKLIYISTDSVYGGCKGPYDETMLNDPCNWYGKTKLESEWLVMDRTGSLILRTNLYGWNIQDKLSLAEWFLNELKACTSIKGFADVRFSSIYTFLLAEILAKCIERDLTGIYNCGCRDSLSKYEFGRKLADIFGFDNNLILPSSIDDAGLQAQRGKDLSLNVGRLENDLGENLPTMAESLARLYKDWETGFPVEIKRHMSDELPSAGYPRRDRMAYGGQAVDHADIDAVVRVLKSPYLTQGEQIGRFEDEVASFVGACSAVAVSSGTAALHLACMGCGMLPEHEGVTSPITFLASANCFVYCGAKPLFADIDPQTYNMSARELESRITEKTRIVIPVHFAGQSCDMKAIKAVVSEKEKAFGHRIYIIEDASHALGSFYRNQRVGCCEYSDAAVFSFHPVKHITTAEGGMVVTNDPEMARRIRELRTHGITKDQGKFINRDIAFSSHLSDGVGNQTAMPWYYEQQSLGYNYRLTDIQCALGRSQLKKLAWFQKRRRAIVEKYNRAFENVQHITTPFESPECKSNFHLYVLKMEFESSEISRLELMRKMQGHGIQTQVHYIPVHLQPYYQEKFGSAMGDYPKAEKLYSQCLSIPLYPAMTDMDANKVIVRIKETFGNA